MTVNPTHAHPIPWRAFMKKLAPLCAAVAMLACESPTTPHTLSVPGKRAAAVIYNTREQVIAGVINDCTGEGFRFDATLRNLLEVTENANGFHATHHASLYGKAVSLLTGAEYTVNDVINLELNTSAGENFTFQDHFMMVGKGSVPNEVFHFQTHYTITPNGTVTASYDHFTVHCQE
ncbi:MAG: hypothetical protein JWM95_5480 [Gemmatimonadetes bacterium]|nr:hypothetical protein [Gemmatimonadota bacterium]